MDVDGTHGSEDPETPEERDDVEVRLGVLVGQLNAVHAALVDLVAEVAESGAWNGVGVRSLTHWLTWQAGLSRPHAVELVRLAGAKVTHPVTMGVFADGGLTVDQAAVAVQAPPHNDAEVAELAPFATVTQIRAIVKMAHPPVEPAAPDPPDETVSTWFDRDGRFFLSAELDADRGRVVDAALSAARDRLFRDGHPGVSWVDALVDICERSYDHETLERRDRFRINMFFDLTDPVPARWADRSPVPDSIRQHLTCDGTFTPTFIDQAHPVSVGNSVAGIPERTRRLVMYRDQGCRVPWCTQTRWLDVHHITHREHGGTTELPNLVALCRRCHRAHHRGDIGIIGNADLPDGLTFSDHRGQPPHRRPHHHPTQRTPTRPPPPLPTPTRRTTPPPLAVPLRPTPTPTIHRRLRPGSGIGSGGVIVPASAAAPGLGHWQRRIGRWKERRRGTGSAAGTRDHRCGAPPGRVLEQPRRPPVRRSTGADGDVGDRRRRPTGPHRRPMGRRCRPATRRRRPDPPHRRHRRRPRRPRASLPRRPR